MFIHHGYQDVVINGIQRALNIQEYDTIQFTISVNIFQPSLHIWIRDVTVE